MNQQQKRYMLQRIDQDLKEKLDRIAKENTPNRKNHTPEEIRRAFVGGSYFE